jgi:hypothetical protein
MACEKYKKGSSAFKSCMKKEKVKRVAKIGAQKLINLSGAEVGSKEGRPELTYGKSGFISADIGKGWNVRGSYRKQQEGMGWGGGDYDYNIGISKELGPRKKKKKK